jgi:Fe-S-cluster containining protein
VALLTDLAEIRRRARASEEIDWVFRRRLKDCSLEDDEIDAAVFQTHRDVAQWIDCKTCGNCCRELVPALDRKDIDRLAIADGLTAGAFRQKYLKPADEPGRLVFTRKPCAFLEGNLCRHYESRPRACREFPNLDKPDFRSRSMLIVWNAPYCPIIFNVIERLKEELGPYLYRA